jgi:hypothetical protein
MSRIHRTLSSLAFAALAAAVAATPALADHISNPGGNCTDAHGSLATGATTWDGSFGTDSTTSTLSAYCPVETRSSAPVASAAQVTFLDRNTTANACCSLNSQWTDSGGTVWFFSSAAMCTSGFSSGPQTLGTSVSFGALSQTMQFQCSVPPKTANGRSAIQRYQVTR